MMRLSERQKEVVYPLVFFLLLVALMAYATRRAPAPPADRFIEDTTLPGVWHRVSCGAAGIANNCINQEPEMETTPVDGEGIARMGYAGRFTVYRLRSRPSGTLGRLDTCYIAVNGDYATMACPK